MYLIPKPKTIRQNKGAFYLSFKSRIVIDEKCENGMLYASIIKEEMEKWSGFSPAVIKGRAKEEDIYLTISPSLSAQAYELDIEEQGIKIAGGDGAGVLYGAQTLCQLIRLQGSCLSCMEISDFPDILHRGYYLDQTRGRVMKLPYLKKVADRLCRYKINEFQLYVEHTYLFENFSEMWRDETPLTAEEIMELDSYCRQRHIELIPSLSSFGHLYTLLSTKCCEELCELPDSEKQPFSFQDRMMHHTVNVADERVLPMIRQMLKEYMALFTSRKFNLGGDETFDLGKGRAKSLAEEKGVHRIYIDYIKDLCEFLVSEGRQPMFWGDVICGEPELIKELPKEVICLNWGYAPDQGDKECQALAQVHVKQYLCPGVCGWNQWMNLLRNSYENIKRMCSYAVKYDAMGILNTDWGDFGHINHPEYSTPGLIYGAAFSWNQENISFEEINRQIARLEFSDPLGKTMELLAEIPEYCLFNWWDAVMYYEIKVLGEPRPVSVIHFVTSDEEAARAEEGLLKIEHKWKETICFADSSARPFMQDLDITLEGIRLWNGIGRVADIMEKGEKPGQETCFALAEKLEIWFMAYKNMWRRTSKEGDLHHIADIVFWYADLLRGRQRGAVKKL